MRVKARSLFLTFGDGASRYRRASRRLNREAKKSGLFTETAGHNLKDLRRLDPAFCLRHAGLLSRNVPGFGYWLWKPRLLLYALQQPRFDFIVYSDAGCVINPDETGRTRLVQYFGIADSQDVFAISTGGAERQYTKPGVLDYLKVSPVARESPQIGATVLIFKRGVRAAALVERWLELCEFDGYRLLDDSGDTPGSQSSFVGHRHDQSIFSCLAKECGIEPSADSSYFPREWQTSGHESPIWAARHRWGSPFPVNGTAGPFLRVEHLVDRLELGLAAGSMSRFMRR